MTSPFLSPSRWGAALLALAGPAALAQAPARLVNTSDQDWHVACFQHSLDLRVTTRGADGLEQVRRFPRTRHDVLVGLARGCRGDSQVLARALRGYRELCAFQFVVPRQGSALIEAERPDAAGGAEFVLVDGQGRMAGLGAAGTPGPYPRAQVHYQSGLRGTDGRTEARLHVFRSVPQSVLASTAPAAVTIRADRWDLDASEPFPGLPEPPRLGEHGAEALWLLADLAPAAKAKAPAGETGAGVAATGTMAAETGTMAVETKRHSVPGIPGGGAGTAAAVETKAPAAMDLEADAGERPKPLPHMGVTGLAYAGDLPGAPQSGHWLGADLRSHRILLVGQDGQARPWLGGKDKGHQDGCGAEVRFAGPAAVAVRPKPWLAAVAERDGHCIRAIDQDGRVTTLAGRPGLRGHLDGEASLAIFDQPVGLAWGPDGALYVADRGNNCIRRIHGGTVSTVTGLPGKAPDKACTSAWFNDLGSLAADPATGVLYACDHHRICRITPKGEVTEVAGSAELRLPHGLAVAGGRLFIADTFNHRLVALDLAGEGKPTALEADATLEWPAQLALDDRGRALVSNGYGSGLVVLGPLKAAEAKAGLPEGGAGSR